VAVYFGTISGRSQDWKTWAVLGLLLCWTWSRFCRGRVEKGDRVCCARARVLDATVSVIEVLSLRSGTLHYITVCMDVISTLYTSYTDGVDTKRFEQGRQRTPHFFITKLK
jgi:hypothetical protein